MAAESSTPKTSRKQRLRPHDACSPQMLWAVRVVPRMDAASWRRGVGEARRALSVCCFSWAFTRPDLLGWFRLGCFLFKYCVKLLYRSALSLQDAVLPKQKNKDLPSPIRDFHHALRSFRKAVESLETQP